MFSEPTLKKAKAGDVDALAELDARGLLLGPGETPADFVQRLGVLQGHYAEMETEIRETGHCTVEDVTVEGQARIDPRFFAEAGDVTEAAYAFRIDWAPGFYMNPRMAWLFGGCAFSFYPDFFTFFIIRQAFATRERWLIYGRRELLAHELCHVARIALQSRLYEEHFAYQTSGTAFRQHIGSIFRTQTDSYMFLGSTLLLLAGQVTETVFLATAKGVTAAFAALMILGLWGLVIGVFLFLVLRHAFGVRRFNQARRVLALVFGDRARAVQFRCTDEEILELAPLHDLAAVQAWLEKRQAADWRWKIIRRRFGQPAT